MHGIRGKWGLMAWWLAASLLPLQVSFAASRDAANEMPNLVKQWLNLSHQQQQLKQQWASEKPILEQRLQLLEQEKTLLSNKASSQQGGQTEVAQKREQLVSEQVRLESEQTKLHAALRFHRSQLAALVNRMPPPLAHEWRQVLENGALAQADQSEAAQLQAILGLYQKWADFQKRIVVQEASIVLENDEVMVDQLYVGVSQAWFVSKDGSKVGIGSAQGTQWQWQVDERIEASTLKTAIAMYRKQQPSDFVTLPSAQFVGGTK